MNKIRYFVFTYLILFSFVFFSPFSIGNSVSNSSTSLNTDTSLKVLSNAELISFVNSNSILGDGSINNPFIIQNKIFSASGINYQIEIRNTDYYILIRNNIISNALQEGILLSNVSNIIVDNNQLTDNAGDAILVNLSRNIIIRNNLITGTLSVPTFIDFKGLTNFPFSIDIAYSRYIYVQNNTLKDNNDGIWFWGGDIHSLAENNTIENSYFEGIGVGGELKTHNITIRYNTITNVRYGIWLVADGGISYVFKNSITNSSEGILVQYAFNSKILNNTIKFNTKSGIDLTKNCADALVQYNLVQENEVGIIITQTGHKILYNDFINNNKAALATSNKDINVSYNYWSSFSSEDKDNDGIYDSPYKLEGPVTLYDNFPLIF